MRLEKLGERTTRSGGGEAVEECLLCLRISSGGLRLKDILICRDCEQRLVETEPGDLLYDYFLDRLREFSLALTE